MASTTTAKVTRSSVLAAARRRHGASASLRESKGAPSPSERQKIAARQLEVMARLDEIKPRIGSLTRDGVFRKLLEAARFVVDVGGDDPSIPRLADVVAEADAIGDADDEYSQLDAERARLSAKRRLYRWRLTKKNGLLEIVLADGDTLDEILAKL